VERKTKVHAQDGRADFVITREFDLPIELLFRAHADPDLFVQWMSHEWGTTHALKWEFVQHGGWHFHTIDAEGKVLFAASGTFHGLIENQKIIRTFEMDPSTFDVQLEFLEFDRLDADTSRLTMQSVFRSIELRDQLLKLPFEFGLNMAHNRLQQVIQNTNE
jgi:uncharacterized protein YndB with AHSA1/START domain